MDEEQHLVKHQQLDAFVEQRRITEERKIIEQQRIEDKKFEQKQQQEINRLFEFVEVNVTEDAFQTSNTESSTSAILINSTGYN